MNSRSSATLIFMILILKFNNQVGKLPTHVETYCWPNVTSLLWVTFRNLEFLNFQDVGNLEFCVSGISQNLEFHKSGISEFPEIWKSRISGNMKTLIFYISEIYRFLVFSNNLSSRIIEIQKFTNMLHLADIFVL